MKISHIGAENFMRLSSVSISIPTGVLLVAGHNEAGKSSLAEAVRFAITGESPRIALKKHRDQLIRVGAEKGFVSIALDDKQVARRISDGKLTASEGMPLFEGAMETALRICLGETSFAALEPEERRAFLFDLCGVKITREVVLEKLRSRGFIEDDIETILPHLRAGFAAAEAKAKEIAAEGRAGWKAITGQQYGSDIASTWRRQSTTVSQADLDKAKATHDADSNALRDASLDLMKKRSARSLAAENQARLDRLKAEAAGANEPEPSKPADDLRALGDAIEGLLSRFQNARNAQIRHNDAVEQATREIAAFPKSKADRLAELEATVLPRSQPCPECGTALDITHDGKIEYADASVANELGMLKILRDQAAEAKVRLEKLSSVVVDDPKTIELELIDAQEKRQAAAARWDEYRTTHSMWRSKRAAAEALQNAQDSLAEPPSAEEVAAAEEAERAAADAAGKSRAAYETLRDASTIAQSAAKDTERAALLHAQAVTYTKLAEALSPNGIQGELLNAALSPFNRMLADSAEIAGSAPPVVNEDMTITRGGRLYSLLSESAKWKVDALFTEVISRQSGIKCFLLDRLDVIDPPSRGEWLNWVSAMAEDHDTIIVLATLTSPPVVTNENITVIWMSEGAVENTA